MAITIKETISATPEGFAMPPMSPNTPGFIVNNQSKYDQGSASLGQYWHCVIFTWGLRKPGGHFEISVDKIQPGGIL